MDNLTDEQLAEKYKTEDDSEALGLIFRRYEGYIARICYNFFQLNDTVWSIDDIKQEVFVRLITAMKTYNPKRGHVIGYIKLHTWAICMKFYKQLSGKQMESLNEFVMILNQYTDESDFEVENEKCFMIESYNKDILDRLILKEQIDDCLRMVKSFSKLHQDIFKKKFLEQKTYREVSAEIGVSHQTIHNHAKLILRRLKNMLKSSHTD